MNTHNHLLSIPIIPRECYPIVYCAAPMLTSGLSLLEAEFEFELI
jgi:hypothetical protein